MGRGRERWRLKIRRWGRRLVVAASAAALAGAMLTAVDRGSRARELSEEISRLEREEARARSRTAAAMRRLDSLTSRDRIAREAAELGLRPASDEEITFLRDAPSGSEGKGSR